MKAARGFSGATIILIACLITSASRAQEVVQHPDTDAPLEQRWQWADPASRAACSQGCWIAYSIHRMMEEDSYIGSYGDRRGSTLQSIVYGREVEPLPARSDDEDESESERQVLKEVAFLFRYEAGSLQEIDVSNISLPVDLEGRSIVWLGLSDLGESVRFLRDRYAGTGDTELKEELVSAVGLHGADDLVVQFLTEVLESNEQEDVREEAVFWLAETEHESVLPLLDRTARGDTSEDVREEAVFGISRIETEEADELLIQMARGLDDRETREEAIFWLGQKASERAASSLQEIVENDPDVEIQKQAVFAISQLDDNAGVPHLINIVRTHRNARIRHEAIFWLGESGDERAVDELARIVRGQ